MSAFGRVGRLRARRREGLPAGLRPAQEARAARHQLLGAPRRDLRLRRPERRREDDDAQDPDRPDPRRRRARPRSSATRCARPSSAAQVGFLPENPYFYDFLTGREILHFYARLSGVPGEPRRGASTSCSSAGRPRPRRRRAAAHLLEGHAPAHRHRPGAGARPRGRVPRRADERPRPDRPQGDPRPDRAAPRRGQDHLHEHPHPLRRGDALRPRRDHREGAHPLRGPHRGLPRAATTGAATSRSPSLPPELAEAFERRFGAVLAGGARTSSSASPRSTRARCSRRRSTPAPRCARWRRTASRSRRSSSPRSSRKRARSAGGARRASRERAGCASRRSPSTPCARRCAAGCSTCCCSSRSC